MEILGLSRMTAFQMADVEKPAEAAKKSMGPELEDKKDSTINSLKDKKDVPPASAGCMSKISAAFSAVIGWVSNMLSYLFCCCCCKMDDRKVLEHIENSILAPTDGGFQRGVDALPRQAAKEVAELARKYVLIDASKTGENEDLEITADVIANAKNLDKVAVPADMDAQIAKLLKDKKIYEIYADVLKARLPKKAVEPSIIK